MSQTQVQLLGNVVTGAIISGIVTASEIKIGDSIGINTSGIITATGFVGNLTGDATGLSGTPNINVGVVTATSFSGDGSGLTGVGIGSDGSVNTIGIITASTISANEFVGTGDKLIFSPTVTSFNPIDGAIDVGFDTQISLTFDQAIYAGVGTITIRSSSGIGTVLESIGIGSTSQISINNQTLTITPASLLPTLTDVYVVLPEGVVVNSLGSKNPALDTYNFTTVDFDFVSISPTNGATEVDIGSSIVVTFTSTPRRGTGTIEIKEGSIDGPIVESFNAATSPRITTAGDDWTLTPSSVLGYTTSFYTIIPNTAIEYFAGINTVGGAITSHNFITRGLATGDAYGGGYLICQSGGTNWVVAPSTSEVTTNWYNRSAAATCAQTVTGCTGWFVPTTTQLQNPGYVCRTNWDSYATEIYMSDTNAHTLSGGAVDFANGSAVGAWKPNPYRARAFRCVAY